ncbi:hypothetical protein CDAR_436611 [Caerostris darwini]|uniref:Uncharacterized protein n=1 Tax=Caerostris darwini TaxID=1538125 RepID=A0AAV4SEN1_9ARAC|nr:hypothetical protein CDAR_436611 [Caerostris darwini]
MTSQWSQKQAQFVLTPSLNGASGPNTFIWERGASAHQCHGPARSVRRLNGGNLAGNCHNPQAQMTIALRRYSGGGWNEGVGVSRDCRRNFYSRCLFFMKQKMMTECVCVAFFDFCARNDYG